jgi:hypothetical protein
MKRTTILSGIMIIALALTGLLISRALALTGDYDVSFWAVNGGGGSSTGSNYAVDGTIGQSIAGQRSGGSYALEEGFWDSQGRGPVPAGGPIYLPLVDRPNPTPTPLPPPPACADIEDNNLPQTAKQLTTIGQACKGSFDNDPNTPQGDDYYLVVLNVVKTIRIDLTSIPSQANYDLVLYDARILANPNAPYIGLSNKPGQQSEQIVYLNAAPGNYYLRVYMRQRSPVAADTYLLQVTLQ